MKKKVLALFGAVLIASIVMSAAVGQQPQSQTAPIYPVNAKYVNGVAPGYAPTAGTGLTLNVGAGTANCGGAIAVYIAGTLTMTASATNYVYLNTSASCVPAVKTTSFTSSDIPIATVTTSGSAITGITDDRTMFQQPGVPGGAGTVNSGSSGQIAYYPSTGAAVSGTNALPSGTTATTQSVGDNSTKVATTAFVLANAGSSGSASPSSSIYNSQIQRAANQVIRNNATSFSSTGTQAWYVAPAPASVAYQNIFAADTYYYIHAAGDQIQASQIKSMAHNFVAAASGGNLPIALTPSGTAYVFYSGCQSDHTTPTLDGAIFTPLMELEYYNRTGDISQFNTDASALKTALLAIPLDGTTHLVNVPSAHPYASWGFHDGIAITGNDLMGSLLLWQASKAMAALYTANSDSTNATTFSTMASNIAASLGTGSALWNATDGMYYAATGNNNQDDVLGSAFAVYLGVASSGQQTAISTYLNAHYSTLIVNGYVHQSPSNWAVSVGGNQCGNGVGNYDDGTWSVGNEWVYYALQVNSQANAQQLVQDFANNADPTKEFYGSSTNGATSNLESPMGMLAVVRSRYPSQNSVVLNIAGLVKQGSGVSLGGSGTQNDPYVVSATAGSGGNYINIGGSVTWSGCTYASGTCVVGSGGSATLSISSIPSGYQALKIFVNGAESGASNGGWRWVFNSDTAAHYAFGFSAGSPLSGASAGSSNYIQLCGMSGILNASGELTLSQYANTNVGNKMMIGVCVLPLSSTASATSSYYWGSGQWNNTAAITSISLTVADASNFLQNSTIQIYGLN